MSRPTLVSRTSVIASSGKDKHTFDSERADPPARPSSRDTCEASDVCELEDVLVKRESVVKRLDVPNAGRDPNGKFRNPWPSLQDTHPSLAFNILHSGRVADKRELERALPVQQPDFAPPPDADHLAITWLGHSTVLVRLDGVCVLTDPVFSERASPSQAFGPKRYTRSPISSVFDLPAELDAVLISHAHYDHLDRNSVLLLNARFGADLRFFVPRGLGQWFAALGVENCVELEWWQEGFLPDKSHVSFVFLPAQHWSRRTLTDHNRALWGGWAVVGPDQRFYFAGDSGYCDVFRQIGRLYGPFSAAAIPIGAYAPRALLRQYAVSPEEALLIHQDVRSRFSLAVHWGTFALTDEPPLEPKRRLEAALAPLDDRSFHTFFAGETRHVRK